MVIVKGFPRRSATPEPDTSSRCAGTKRKRRDTTPEPAGAEDSARNGSGPRPIKRARRHTDLSAMAPQGMKLPTSPRTSAERLAKEGAHSASASDAPAARLAQLKTEEIIEPFSIPLKHGTLKHVESRRNSNQQLRHHAIYSPKGSQSILSSNFSDFLPSQHNGKLYKEKLDGLTSYLSECENDLGAILVAHTSEGELMVLDGHHRLAAALAANVPLDIEIDPRSEPDQKKGQDWSVITLALGSGSDLETDEESEWPTEDESENSLHLYSPSRRPEPGSETE